MLPDTANDMLTAMQRDHGLDSSHEPTRQDADRRAPRGLRTMLGGALLALRSAARPS